MVSRKPAPRFPHARPEVRLGRSPARWGRIKTNTGVPSTNPDPHCCAQACPKLVDYYRGEGLPVSGPRYCGIVASETAVARALPVVDRRLKERLDAPQRRQEKARAMGKDVGG